MGSAASASVQFDWDPTAFPKLGVKVSFIDEFFEACGGRNNLEGLTTTDVCEKYVKEVLTQTSQTSLCQLLQHVGHPAVGIATVFISHAWKYKFLDVLSAIQSHFQDAPDTIIWFDLFSNNQHKATSLDYEWWSTTFKSAIAQFGHTVMVLSPWDDPIPYQRAWCIFEAYCTAVTESRFEIAMSAAERDRFVSDIVDHTSDKIDKMLATITAERSECYKPEDRERIFSAIQQSVGFSGINSLVFEQYRQWVVTVTEAALEQAQRDQKNQQRSLALMSSLGALYRGQGRFEQALPLFEECLHLRTQELGAAHLDTLQSVNSLAGVHLCQRNFPQAQVLYEECLAQRKVVLGAAHPDTLSSMCNLAIVLKVQGNTPQAQSLYEECLAQRKVVLGVSHPDTLASVNNLAMLYKTQGNLSQSQTLYEECLPQLMVVLGASHPQTLKTMANLAMLYLSQGNMSEAETLHAKCLAQQRVVLGATHPDTLLSMCNQALVYQAQGNESQAQALYEECLVQRRGELELGAVSPSTLALMNNLANVYKSQGKMSQAQTMYEECLVHLKVVLGATHPQTLKTMGNLADLYEALGRMSDAEALYKECQTQQTQM